MQPVDVRDTAGGMAGAGLQGQEAEGGRGRKEGAARRRRRRRLERERRAAGATTATIGEMRAVYEHAGNAVVRLMGKTGRKWAKVRRLRMRQRRLMLKMIQHPDATKAMKRLLQVVDVRSATLREFEKGAETSSVYVQAHPTVKHAYCGKHKGVADSRKEQHDRFIYAAQCMRVGDAPRTGALPWHAYAGRHGGVGQWIDLPVVTFDADVHPDEVDRCERK